MMKRGPYYNRKEKYEEARLLRRSGLGYRSISNVVGIHWRTIKNWVYDIKIDSKEAHRKSSVLRRKSFEDLKSDDAIKKFLIRERGWICQKCNNTKWLGVKIPLELEHLDGDHANNKKENLKLYCLNCHGLSPTWRRKKRKLNI